MNVHGQLSGVLIECADSQGELAGHRCFSLDASAGLQLCSGEQPLRRPGIERYVRVDQSRRGLQYKNLRRGVKLDDLLWTLVASAHGDRCPGSALLWMARKPTRLRQRLFLDADAARLRSRLIQQWLERSTGLACQRPGRLALDPLLVLNRLIHFGVDPETIWALRCDLQRLRLKLSADDEAFDWTDGLPPDRPFPRLLRAELVLYARCAEAADTADFGALLNRMSRARDVRELAAAAADMSGSGHRVLLDHLETGLGKLREEFLRDRARDPAVHGREWQLGFRERKALDDLPPLLARAGSRRAISIFLELAREVCSRDTLVNHGVTLHEAGLPEGRELLAWCLQCSAGLSGRQRARALKALLAAPSDAVA